VWYVETPIRPKRKAGTAMMAARAIDLVRLANFINSLSFRG
jgi:hypothetical protein